MKILLDVYNAQRGWNSSWPSIPVGFIYVLNISRAFSISLFSKQNLTTIPIELTLAEEL
jgi:hypothetical protein